LFISISCCLFIVHSCSSYTFTLSLHAALPISIENFQADFLRFVEESVPPRTYDAIAAIIDDILNNSNSGLLSSGFIISIFVMANGLNSILGGFETSHHVLIKRGFVRQYMVALAMSLLMSFILLFTVAIIVVFEVFIQSSLIQDVIPERIPLIVWGRYVFVGLMILVTSSLMLKFGTKHTGKRAFISVGSVFTTILIILSSYVFEVWVVKFSNYNELYGSIGTLLIMMFYIWLNCVILLLGFELNQVINRLKRKNLYTCCIVLIFSYFYKKLNRSHVLQNLFIVDFFADVGHRIWARRSRGLANHR